MAISLAALWIAAASPAWAQQPAAAETEAIASLLALREGASVADIGAGAGSWTVQLAGRVGPNGAVYATEVKPELVRQIERAAARNGLENVTVIAARHDDPNLPENCCDAVLMRLVYHALRDTERTREGLRRALKPGGRLLVIDFRPSVQELAAQLREFGFEPGELTNPWVGPKGTYGALFIRAESQ